ncbi:hypothetical protein HanPSC8_Chr10g0404991 [Helianthus annuus]|nr:hypothetical protein HanPSC8_Chr10g0404991 [Helianthus annuus]
MSSLTLVSFLDASSSDKPNCESNEYKHEDPFLAQVERREAFAMI